MVVEPADRSDRAVCCSRMAWASPNPWNVACPARTIASAVVRIFASIGRRVPGFRGGMPIMLGRYLPNGKNHIDWEQI